RTHPSHRGDHGRERCPGDRQAGNGCGEVTIRIEAMRLIPGRGDPIDSGVVVLEDTTIAYAGAAGDAPETPNAEVVSTDTVMPGLWDCHGHFMGVRGASIDEISTIRPQVGAMRVTADARSEEHTSELQSRENLVC